jgi:hypothetical protein
VNGQLEAQAVAARAAREFVLLVLALQAAARRDPRWAVALVMVAADPMLLATALVMTVIAHQQAAVAR